MPSSIAPKVQNPGSARLRLARPCGGLLLVAVMLIAAGSIGCGADHGRGGEDMSCHGGHGGPERFALGRSSLGMFLRTDSRTGQVWIMPFSGDGGWVERGTAPDLAELPARNGRFEVLSVPQARRQLNRSSAVEERAVLVRFDSDTGRTWLLADAEAAAWSPVVDPNTLPEAEESTGQSDPASSSDTEAAEAVRPSAAGSDQEPSSSGALDETSETAYPILTGDQLGVTPEEKQESLDTLQNALTKEGLPRKMRLWAVRQLGELDPDLSVPVLIVGLDDEDPVIVAEAVRQLGRSRRPSALPAVLKLRNHPDAGVREAVSEIVLQVP